MKSVREDQWAGSVGGGGQLGGWLSGWMGGLVLAGGDRVELSLVSATATYLATDFVSEECVVHPLLHQVCLDRLLYLGDAILVVWVWAWAMGHGARARLWVWAWVCV